MKTHMNHINIDMKTKKTRVPYSGPRGFLACSPGLGFNCFSASGVKFQKNYKGRISGYILEIIRLKDVEKANDLSERLGRS